MKRITLSIIVIFSIFSVSAQKMNICDAFRIIEQESVKRFSALNLGKDSTDKINTSYLSSVQIIEAKNSKIVSGINGITFKADFGTYNSYEEVKLKVNDLCASLFNCFAGLKASISSEKIFNTESYTFYLINNEGFRVYAARFKILPLGNNYNLSFNFDASAEATMMDRNPVQAHTDYMFIQTDRINNSFSNSMQKVLEEAKTGFTNIKQDLLPEQTGFFKTFASEYRFQQLNCHIEERGLGITNYVLPKVGTFTNENANESYAEIFKKVNESLGKEYGFCNSPDKMNIYFAHKDRPDKRVVSLILNSKNGEYWIDLLVHNQE